MLGQDGAGCGGQSGAGARRVPGARRTVRDFVRAVRAGGADRHARRVRRCVRILRTGDRGRHRGRCHRGCHPDADPPGAAVLADGRSGRQRGRHRRGRAVRRAVSPGRMRWSSWRWPKAELARWGGNAEEARHQLGVATTLWATTRSRRTSALESHDVLGYLADDLRRGPYPPRRGLAGGVRGGARTPDRPGTRRVRGPGPSLRPVRAGGAAARGQRRRARTCRIAPTRMRPGSSRRRGVTSAKHGSPR